MLMAFETFKIRDVVKEPILRKILLLVLTFSVAFALILGVEAWSRHVAGRTQAMLADNRARHSLSRAIVAKLLLMEVDLRRISLAHDADEIQQREQRLAATRGDVELALEALDHGGVYTDVLRVNLNDTSRFGEQISFSQTSDNPYANEVDNLAAYTAKAGDIARGIVQAIKQISAEDIRARRAAEEKTALLLKQAGSILLRARATANSISHKTLAQTRRIEAHHHDTATLHALIRYAGSAAIAVVALLLFLRILTQTRRIIASRRHAKESADSLNAELEKRVQERTQNLTTKLDFLQLVMDAIPAPVFYEDTRGVCR